MKRKPIQLFVSDMDGTLLQADFTISSGNLEAIRKLEAAGIRFAVATGRIHYDASVICIRHSLEPYIISNNGTCMFDPEGKLIEGREIESTAVKSLIRFLEEENICFGLGESRHYVAREDWQEVFEKEIEDLKKEGKAVSEERAAFIKQETREQNGVMLVKDMQEHWKQGAPVYSISVISCDDRKIRKVQNQVRSYEGLTACISGTHNAEIMRQDGTKGHMLELLCSHLQIPLEQTAAAGDSLNDLEMIEKSGFGIAMGNGREEVKRAASLVTRPAREDGIAEAAAYILKNLQ